VPADVSPPTISGTADAGQVLSELHGTWSNGTTSFAYQWERCNGAGGNCQVITHATSRTLSLTAVDVGSTIRVLETASNASGSGLAATSKPTSAVRDASGGGQGGGGGSGGSGGGGGSSGGGGGSSGGGGQGGGSSGGGQGAAGHKAPKTRLLKETVSSRRHTATFRFTATGDWTRFQCALIRLPTRKGAKTPSPRYSSCGSPKTFTHLKAGRYRLRVRAVGPGGADKSPAVYGFRMA
jgi:hypothetical protein